MPILIGVFVIFNGFITPVHAATEGSIRGTVVDDSEVALPDIEIEVQRGSEGPKVTVKSNATGEFNVGSLTIGEYSLRVSAAGFQPMSMQIIVGSGSNTQVQVKLQKGAKEMVLEVRAKKRMVQQRTSNSSTDVSQDQIKTLPQGSEISLPKLLTTTSPGVVGGPFGQVFFRGNHANIQYQIDGIQLPDSPSNTFGQSFSPRNIDQMEVITGGIAAEYGERLAAVLNIVTKSGPETPGGEAEVNYGSYNTMSPHLLYGGSNSSGSVHYYASANYHVTDRGLDTPEPQSPTNLATGGEQAVHDHASGDDEFVKVDWLYDNSNKISLIMFNAHNNFQIPNYPSSFSPGLPMFNANPPYTDPWGNGSYIYTPSTTNDWQDERNAYAEIVWKHTFSNRSFLQLAPYYKYSSIHFQNDPSNDLFSGNDSAASFYENRTVNNAGLKGDYTLRLNDQNLMKTGFQTQYSKANGLVSVQTTQTPTPTIDTSPDVGASESLYIQDDYSMTSKLTFNLGLRFDATQFWFSDTSPSDSALQPRIGVSYLFTEDTKVHAFYGKLFQPSPVENLRDTFANSGGGQLLPYNVKAEKDDYYEVGVAHQFAERQAALVNVYYKDAHNMLDEEELFNTSIFQPFNFDKGYAYGVEVSLKGDLSAHWSEYFNYSYEIAKGRGLSGGIFAFSPSQAAAIQQAGWQFLDHVQVQTANAGLTYTKDRYWLTGQALYGSGLRTDPTNGTSLPSHITFDATFGYKLPFYGLRASLDVLNILDRPYPITISNGFNGSHYAPGREFFVRLAGDF
jgi:outer membrane receptor protein involved in Fe transport